jgi:hypothetical protein
MPSHLCDEWMLAWSPSHHWVMRMERQHSQPELWQMPLNCCLPYRLQGVCPFFNITLPLDIKWRLVCYEYAGNSHSDPRFLLAKCNECATTTLSRRPRGRYELTR